MDGFYGSYDPTSDHQYHNYADKDLLPSTENLYDQCHNYSYRVGDSVGRVLGSSDQESRFQSLSGVAVSEIHGDHKQSSSSLMKATIASHPSYPKLLSAYIDCQKVGAPPEMATFLDHIKREEDHLHDQELGSTSFVGEDPELDEFMETFCEVLLKCKTDLSRPFDEATSFLNRVESQLGNLTCNNGEVSALSSSDDEEEARTISSGRQEISIQDLQMKNEDHREVKDMLMRKYGGGQIGRLKMEFSKSKKRVKLPKEARQALLEWWNLHYKWPYPTETDKISLADSTGLDHKQINNWFINQRKRHWKSSDNMHLAMMDSHFFNED